jgi:Domain of unknown function (DUF4159)
MARSISRLVLLLTLALVYTPAHAVTPDEVEQSLKRAKEFLYSQQKGGNWERVPQRIKNGTPLPDREGVSNNTAEEGGQWGGVTSLVTYALLASGEQSSNPKIQEAVSFLKTAEIVGIYALALRANVWAQLPSNEDIKQAIRRDTRLLLAAQKKQGRAKGLFDYVDNGPQGNRVDHSVSQYGVLGVWACSENIEGIPQQFWVDADKAWRDDQATDGGWCYREKPDEKYPTSPSMTAAGIATLFITQDFLFRAKGIDCTGNIIDKNIESGLKWITANFDRVYNPDIQRDTYYTLYGVERIGLASGYKYFGDINWFDNGADWLIKKQAANGAWGRSVNSTAFAVLFLSRGRAPVMMNKLDYETASSARTADAKAKINWNQRPRDSANIARWVGRQGERELNWQVVNFNADAADLHDAPILYLAGNQTLNFNQKEKDKLREFVEQGGMILGNADCATADFVTSFRKLGSELFPAYEFRTLPADHVIYTDQQFPAVKWKKKPEVLGLSNGARELMILLPSGDPSRYWQIMASGTNEEFFQLAADIFLYSVDKRDLRFRGETFVVTPDPKIKPESSVKVARIKYNGNWDPEPGGWRRLAAILNNQDKVGLSTAPVELGKGQLKDYKIAHLTGTNGFKFDAIQKTELKQFVDAGGTLLIDAAAGRSEFAQSTENMLEQVFGEDIKQIQQPAPSTDAIYGKGISKPEDLGYRSFARKAVVGNFKGGRLRIMTLNNRPAVIYSREDLSAGMVGEPVDGIMGYDPASATAVMRSIILTIAK